MKMYASCPLCGHKLCKAENGSDVDVKCRHCGENICISSSVSLSNICYTFAVKIIGNVLVRRLPVEWRWTIA